MNLVNKGYNPSFEFEERTLKAYPQNYASSCPPTNHQLISPQKDPCKGSPHSMPS
jgi:hypothetical protein